MRKRERLPASRSSNRSLISRCPDDAVINRALADACRSDFMTFASWCFDYLNPGNPLKPNWHLEALAFRLNAVHEGKLNRLQINLPPRYGKSLFTSVALPAYVLGHDPTKRLIVASHSLELAVKHANDTRQILSSPFYKILFPGTRISRIKNTEYEMVTTRGGYRLATSMQGPLGRGADILVVDDPGPSNVHSKRMRDRVHNQYQETLFTRLNDQEYGAIIIAAQRQHVDDLCGRLSKGNWTVLSLAAIAEEDEQIEIGEGRYHLRRAGEPLHPERQSKSVLEDIRSQLGPDIFAAQYQQRPVPPEGLIFKRTAIQRYDQLPLRTAPPYVLQSWDTAIKAGEQHDYSACVTLLIHDRKFYVVDVLRGRFEYSTLKEVAKSHAQQHKPNQILVEGCGFGPALVSELKIAGFQAVAITPEADKLTRMRIQSAKFDEGLVFLPHEGLWLAELEGELLAVPNAAHDDQVDALCQALAYKAAPSFLWNDTASKNFNRFIEGIAFARAFP